MIVNMNNGLVSRKIDVFEKRTFVRSSTIRSTQASRLSTLCVGFFHRFMPTLIVVMIGWNNSRSSVNDWRTTCSVAQVIVGSMRLYIELTGGWVVIDRAMHQNMTAISYDTSVHRRNQYRNHCNRCNCCHFCKIFLFDDDKKKKIIGIFF